MFAHYTILKIQVFITHVFAEMKYESFSYKCDIMYASRLSALQETVLTVNTSLFCATECSIHPQCGAIELCSMNNKLICRLLNSTTCPPCATDDDIGQTCRHMTLNNADKAKVYNQECKLSQLGNEYLGYVNTTNDGRTCQRWDSQHPHSHTRDAMLPGLPSDHGNHCRNPDNETDGPWCYTTDTSVRWEYCDVPQCAECRTTSTGNEYRGILSTTISGRTCQDWNSQTPHSHNKTAMMPWSASGHGNYCRNPDNRDGGPWCYTTDPLLTLEFCDIKLC